MHKRILLIPFLVFLISCESAEQKAQRFFLKGNVALEEGKNNEAIRLYDEAIAKNPRFKEAYNNKGVALYREGKYGESVDVLTYVMYNYDAYYMDAKRNRLNAALKAQNWSQAADDIRFLMEAYPDSAFVPFKQGELFMALKGYRRAVGSFNASYMRDSSRVDALVNAGIAFYYYGNHNAARLKLEEAMAKDPDEPNIHNTFALIYSDENKYDSALMASNRAIDKDPSNPFYYNNRGYAHLMSGNLEAAEEDINRAILGDPENAWAYRNRGILLYKQEDKEGAIRNFRQAAARDTTLKKMYTMWGDALFELDRKSEACEKWNKSVDLFENTARAKVEEHCY